MSPSDTNAPGTGAAPDDESAGPGSTSAGTVASAGSGVGPVHGHGHPHGHPHGHRGIGNELRHHLPYSIVSVVGAMGIMAILSKVLRGEDLHFLFHVFHPAHLLLSATATTAMFWIHDRKPVKAILIGTLASLPLCGLSDIFVPFLGGLLLKIPMEFHFCLIEEPWIVYPFVAVGVATGLAAGEYVHRSTIYSHAGHVAVSSMASILYLLSYGMTHWVSWIGVILIILLVAVMVPCCLSDIVLPLLFVREKRCEHIKDLDEF